ncbi:glycosyltransferase (plasmid) [Kovacikia minuta CCNUW1]|uniref:glycosyltransferase n=1 Tax=Kovacikia minuta TaxID=2931930 RepID=UPI001CCAA831|nr:glycosyltransferase [Kovacikia minuta]UBF30098.1 glycosyltransferase [Kovacikia minuta CCNUW1]
MPSSISLVTTVYNRQRYLAEMIESILSQTYPYFELLIWDDGSTDDSLAIAQHYATQDGRIRVITAPHQGIAPALKGAIAATTAPYLGWVDSDDLLAPTALEQTIAILDTRPDIGMVYTNYQVIDADGRDRGLGQRCAIPYTKDQLLLDFMTFHFRLMRRSVYEQVGGIDPTFDRAEDYDLCLRLSEVTQIHHLNQPLYFYRQHDSNATNDQLEMIRWAYKASTQALKRRGLDQKYQIDLQVSSRFSIRPRQPKTN